MRLRICFAFSLVLLGACQENEVTNEKPSSDPWAENDEAAFELVLKELRDPESAQFRNVVRVGLLGENPKPDKPLVYCGEVNARNAFGGYAGFVNFAVFGGSAYITDPQLGNVAYASFCVEEDGQPYDGENVPIDNFSNDK